MVGGLENDTRGCVESLFDNDYYVNTLLLSVSLPTFRPVFCAPSSSDVRKTLPLWEKRLLLVTSTSWRVLRRPDLYKDSRR